MYKNKIYLNISLVILHSIVCAISGALGWIIQLIIVQILTFGIVVYSYTKLNKGSNFSFFLPLLFYSFYIPVSVSIKSYQTYPIWISGIVLIVLLRFLLISETSKKNIIFLFIVSTILLSIWFMPNYLSRLQKIKDTSVFDLNKIKIVNDKNQRVFLQNRLGKILIVDIWFSACKPCIKQFPDLEKLKRKYINDSNINIISLNIPLVQRDDRKKSQLLTKKYSFEKLFLESPAEAQKFPINEFPITLVFNKKGKCVYAGDLLLNQNIYIDNIHKIVTQLNEKQ